MVPDFCLLDVGCLCYAGIQMGAWMTWRRGGQVQLDLLFGI
jgi:hypothetical protein